MENLINNKIIKKVNNYKECKEIILSMKDFEYKFNKESFFKSNSLDNMLKKITLHFYICSVKN